MVDNYVGVPTRTGNTTSKAPPTTEESDHETGWARRQDDLWPRAIVGWIRIGMWHDTRDMNIGVGHSYRCWKPPILPERNSLLGIKIQRKPSSMGFNSSLPLSLYIMPNVSLACYHFK